MTVSSAAPHIRTASATDGYAGCLSHTRTYHVYVCTTPSHPHLHHNTDVVHTYICTVAFPPTSALRARTRRRFATFTYTHAHGLRPSRTTRLASAPQGPESPAHRRNRHSCCRISANLRTTNAGVGVSKRSCSCIHVCGAFTGFRKFVYSPSTVHN